MYAYIHLFLHTDIHGYLDTYIYIHWKIKYFTEKNIDRIRSGPPALYLLHRMDNQKGSYSWKYIALLIHHSIHLIKPTIYDPYIIRASFNYRHSLNEYLKQSESAARPCKTTGAERTIWYNSYGGLRVYKTGGTSCNYLSCQNAGDRWQYQL